MPRIRCNYEGCIHLEGNFCTAGEIELDQELGCLTFSQVEEEEIEDVEEELEKITDEEKEWEEEELEDEVEEEDWEDLEDEEDEDDWDDDDESEGASSWAARSRRRR